MLLRRRPLVTVSAVLAITAAFVHLRIAKGITLQSINDARQTAQRNRKFLMVEFGADWCSDCRQLSKQLEEQTTRATLAERFTVVHVDVGELNRHLDIARALGVDVNQGIPAAVFFEPDGSESSPVVGNRHILEYVQEAGE
jgi:thiol:disulfide interchange protein